jgi:GntR family transcriptional regulator
VVAGLIVVDPSHPLPIYAQLDRAIRAAVATGKLGPGAQLPTVRQLAVELKVNANTVARVYLDLERAGILEARRGVGTFVASDQPALGARRGRDAELRALARRAVDEAAARGFSVDDLIAHLTALARDEGKR